MNCSFNDDDHGAVIWGANKSRNADDDHAQRRESENEDRGAETGSCEKM